MTAAERRLFDELSILWVRCAVCHARQCWRGMHFHHIVPGAGRKHDRRNLLRLCGDCHDTLHQGPPANVPDLTRGMILTAKQEVDPEHYDLAWLAGLAHKKWLGYDPEPLADWYIEQRRRNAA